VTSVLFVDDDEQVLEALRDLLRPHRHTWEMTFELSAERGLARLAETAVDVVVSDVKMPGLDGIAFLRDVRTAYPDTVRVVLSGHSEPATAVGSSGVAHRFLAKPCQAAELVEVLESSFQLRSLLTDPALRRATSGLRSLPSAPTAYRELSEALADPETVVERVAAVIERDVGMCAKVLQLVNSSFFGLSRRITNVREATVYLGVETLRTLVIAGESFRSFPTGAKTAAFVAELETHALAVAQTASDLTPEPEWKSDAFMAGMLHDVGKLVFASEFPHEFGRVLELHVKSGMPWQLAEQEICGFSHTEIGSYLLATWGLPVAVVEAARSHHNPELASEKHQNLARLVGAADAIVRTQSEVAA
jgi:HD-like signal output (HDOD) protein/ActR/RegA family two-component response regulator